MEVWVVEKVLMHGDYEHTRYTEGVFYTQQAAQKYVKDAPVKESVRYHVVDKPFVVQAAQY